MIRTRTNEEQHGAYLSLVSFLETAGGKLAFATRRSRRGSSKRQEGLRSSIELAHLDVDADAVLAASNAALVLAAVALSLVATVTTLVTGTRFIMPIVLLLLVIPYLCREAVLSYPSGAARRRAADVLRGSTESVSLMIMSLRHEPSLSKAIRFAAKRGNAYSGELRGCIWSVVMGTHSSFESSLHALGRRWSKYSSELTDSINAMVTASCESTEDGKRRALDRANSAMVTGAKRRIEEYALSLSTPSMIMFGLGILLPLMVGSFLPMLSWNLWSMDAPGAAPTGATDSQSTLQTMFLMNVLFPSIAVLVAMNAISRHPLQTTDHKEDTVAGPQMAGLAVALASSAVGCAAVTQLVHGQSAYVMILVILVGPVSIWLSMGGSAASRGEAAGGLEDALFKTGSRMIDGGNFESALGQAGEDLDPTSSSLVRKLSLQTNATGRDLDSAVGLEGLSPAESNAIEGLRVVREAAAKDEIQAGMLAMDLATYLRDLRELERTLMDRLRPTTSMMKMTVYALGPVVLGVTYAIYLSLTGMVDGGQSGAQAGMFFLVLGLFLAETDAVVSYFVWGIEGRKGRGRLMASTGMCLIVSELVFAATATLAS